MADSSKKISSSSSSSTLPPFKLKKPLRSNFKSLLEDPQSLSSKMPEKPAELSARTKKRKVAPVRESNRRLPTEDKSVRRKIDLWSNESQFESKFFCSLDSAMQLSRFKGVASNFSNVCPKIEALTDGHLFCLPHRLFLFHPFTC
ncbi:CDT1-like protein b [Cucumis melo var. makuwa]|uniref:CDT1-like protein b n=1 Tax=Cucumis melo var. makuwa TaxID=1194695 RepID=A0A5A7V1E4_CUCMM|nr:CDT1-like protein b [Cucumis melo var. makuwa]TYK14104.1 CDT1-like protein b [Cucumis melo var. makuwa]